MSDSRNLLLGLLSVGLVVTWAYHLVDKSGYSGKSRQVFVKDSAAVAGAVADSLQKLYNSELSNLDNKLDSVKINAGQIEGQLSNKLSEINRLKSEIGNILKRTDLTRQDLSKARLLTIELRTRMEELQNRNKTIEEEKNQLVSEFESLNAQFLTVSQNNERLDKENKLLNVKLADAGTYVASELQVLPIQTKAGKETEAILAKRTEKFVISFTLQNYVTSYENSEVFVILTDPNNQVLEFSAWDTGLFETAKEGRKKYTRKIRFAYTKGEPHEIVFSMHPPAYVKGKYQLEVYHNGKRIGKTIKTLS